MGSVSTFLWYDDGAADAAAFYTALIPNSRVLSAQELPDGTAVSVTFELDGQVFQALNAGPRFPFTEAASIFVSVPTQEELDRIWDAILDNGGSESMCGWITDRWGLSWQVIPTALGETLGGADPAGADRAMEAMLQMRRIDVEALRAAYAGTAV